MIILTVYRMHSLVCVLTEFTIDPLASKFVGQYRFENFKTPLIGILAKKKSIVHLSTVVHNTNSSEWRIFIIWCTAGGSDCVYCQW